MPGPHSQSGASYHLPIETGFWKPQALSLSPENLPPIQIHQFKFSPRCDSQIWPEEIVEAWDQKLHIKELVDERYSSSYEYLSQILPMIYNRGIIPDLYRHQRNRNTY